jgi:adenine phosphoribosyltransferase
MAEAPAPGLKFPAYYDLKLAGLERRLPVVEVAPGLAIASFVLLGDTALVEAVAERLAARPELAAAEILVCPEAKAIPLTHALARRLGLDYAVIRKSVKSYMRSPLVENARSITTAGGQTLVLDGADADRLRGKRVGLVDDVVSTGGSLAAAERLLARLPCALAVRAAALLEEGGHSGAGLVYLERLPVFRN